MSEPTTDSRIPFWLAIATLLTALLPILMGALTTTRDAGMAFPDWPSSDGHNMITYPWLRSAGDKFLEHGHRLGGVLIGLVSIALVWGVWTKEPRRWVRLMSVAVLLSVILQGLLGGQRVLLNERGLAFVHGSLAVLVFGLMGALAAVTSRGWKEVSELETPFALRGLERLGIVTLVAIFVQYTLGGLLRHQGQMALEHAGFAAIVFLLTAFTAGAAAFSNLRWLRAPSFGLAGLITLQLVLGLGAWATKFGLPGVVDVPRLHSLPQVVFRTAHVLGGMFVFLSTLILVLRVMRLRWRQQQGTVRVSDSASNRSQTLPLTAKGVV